MGQMPDIGKGGGGRFAEQSLLVPGRWCAAARAQVLQASSYLYPTPSRPPPCHLRTRAHPTLGGSSSYVHRQQVPTRLGSPAADIR